MSPNPEQLVVVLRTFVDDELDGLSDRELEQRVADLEREAARSAGTEDARRPAYELHRCRRALEPNFKKAYHLPGCYVLDQSSNRHAKSRLPLSEVPPNAKPCEICAPPRPVSAARGVPRRDAAPPAKRRTGAAVVAVGMTVALIDDSDKAWTFAIVREGRGAGQVSESAPMGKALLGASVGDTRIVPRPKGGDLRVRVTAIKPTV
jgi:hypothetical protein